MKKLKKILSVILCGIMALSSVLFTACDLFNFNNFPPTNPGDSKVDKILKALTTQEMNGLDLLAMGSDDPTNPSKMHFTWKANLEDAAFDMDYKTYNYYSNDNGDFIESYSFYNFILRDWSLFCGNGALDYADKISYTDFWGQSILDYSTGFGLTYREFFETEYVKYLKHALSFIGYDVKGDKPEDFLKTIAPIFNSIVIATADAAGAVTETETGIDIDLYKTVNVLLSDVKSALQMVAEEKSLLQILVSDCVKKYMESLTRIMNVDKMKEKLNQVYADVSADFKDNMDPADLLTIGKLVSIKPNIESTAYEYLLKIVQSDELDILAKKFMGLGESIKNLKAPIDPQMAQEMISVINSYFTHGENYFIISLPEGEPGWNNFWGTTKIDCKNLKCSYTVNEDNSLKGLYLNGLLDCVQQGRNAGGNISGQFLFSTEKVSLENADEYKILGWKKTFDDGEYVKTNWTEFPYTPDDYKALKIIPIFENGKVIDFTIILVTTKEEKIIETEYTYDGDYLYIPEYNTASGNNFRFPKYIDSYYPSYSLSEISEKSKVVLIPYFKDNQIISFSAYLFTPTHQFSNEEPSILKIECVYDQATQQISFPEYDVTYDVFFEKTSNENNIYHRLNITINEQTYSIANPYGLIDLKDILKTR